MIAWSWDDIDTRWKRSGLPTTDTWEPNILAQSTPAHIHMSTFSFNINWLLTTTQVVFLFLFFYRLLRITRNHRF